MTITRLTAVGAACCGDDSHAFYVYGRRTSSPARNRAARTVRVPQELAANCFGRYTED